MAPLRHPPVPLPLLLLLPLLLPALSRGCSVPPGGCFASKCSSLDSLTLAVTSSNYMTYSSLGVYYGIWNKNVYPNETASRSMPGGPFINYEVYPAVETLYLIASVAATKVTKLSGCCNLCAQTAGCTEYQFFENANYSKIKTGLGSLATAMPGGSYVVGQQCYLLKGGSVAGSYPVPGPNNNGPYGTPYSGDHSLQVGANAKYPPSFVGGRCNPGGEVSNDPHFVGARGTRFDFNGEVGRSFCLISDRGLNVNILLGGYEDTRTYGATVLKNGKAIRTWIKEIGLTWLSKVGQRHVAVLVARAGPGDSRGQGFLAQLSVDGEQAPVPRGSGDRFDSHNGLVLENKGVSKVGPYDLEEFVLTVGNFKATLKLRAAHPLLRTPSDAQVHFNIHVEHMEPTEDIHGILGQTYRPTASQQVKALEYSLLAKLMGGPVVADGASGMGFLDGAPTDYMTSGITAEDSKFSARLQ